MLTHLFGHTKLTLDNQQSICYPLDSSYNTGPSTLTVQHQIQIKKENKIYYVIHRNAV